MHCDVLIVGGGPTGVALGMLIQKSGASVIICEKESDVYPLPRAAHIDHETMRILQEVGVANEIAETCVSVTEYKFFNAAHEVLLEFHSDVEIDEGGWPSACAIHQPSIEHIMRRELEKRPSIELLSQWNCVGFAQNQEGVTATFATPEGERVLRARYMVAADGARSPTRTALGIEFEDLGFVAPWLVVDVLVKDPSALPTYSIQKCDPARPTTCIPMGKGRHRWEFMLKPGETAEEATSDAFISALLKPWNVDEAVEIERRAVYQFGSKIAKQWHKGRVFLAGDAAHQTPPFAGQGLCSGLRDAANLAWKIAAVVQGNADPALLESYHVERKPNLRATIEMALRMGEIVCVTDPVEAVERDKRLIEQRTNGLGRELIRYPDIAEGAISRGNGAGSYFPQLVSDGTRMDDVLGAGAWLLAKTPLGSEKTSDLTCLALESAALKPFAHEIGAWLDAHQAEAVLVRPDRYVFGAGNAAELLNSWRNSVIHA